MNIYRTLSLMAAAIFSATAYCQIMPDNTAQVCAYWSEGDSITYDCISKAEKTNRKGEKTITDSSSEKRTLTVIAKDDNSYTLQVSYKDVYSSNLSLNLNLSIEDYSELCSSVKYNVITNEFGTLQGLGDLEQSLETMRAIISLTMDKVYAGYDKKTWKNLGTTKEQVIKYVTDSFCTPEAISQSCIADISPLLFFHGGRYKMDEEYVVEEPYTNIFGEGQANGETHFWVDTEYSDSTYLVMRTYTKIDGEKIMPMLRDASLSILRAAITDPDVDVEELFDEHVVEDHVGGEFEQYTVTIIHLPSGWPVRWIFDRSVTMFDDNGKDQSTLHQEVKLAED